MTNAELNQVVTRNLNDTVTNYIADARRAGIPEDFIVSFNHWHQQVVDILIASIENTVNSIAYNTQNSRVWSILGAYDAALGATIEDVEKTLENGT
jgi:ATP-dependent 26S proteasome regulatory subunit